MSTRRLVSVGAVTAALASSLAVMPASAAPNTRVSSTDVTEAFLRPMEDDMATATSARPLPGDHCEKVEDGAGPGNVAYGCFKTYGDSWIIQDSKGEGAQTYIYWENWLYDGARWRPYRHGRCNNDLGAPNWGQCNKDYYESGSTNYFGKKGSQMRFQVCDRHPFLPDMCSPTDIVGAPWISNS
ncbi:hypothetical protein V7793_08295 [Streptomyces sp. KLMMK]|uniref:hypothetical protein n=1 Tax=Streptomyces sp. KLMMK TaxID=3109353 RepID=UPI00300A092B